MLELKGYQQRSLEELEKYLRLAVTVGAKRAFIERTDRPYHSVPSLPDLPYVCLRVPTGGGKTLMACHGLGIAKSHFQRADRALCLWLVPTNTIRDQTLSALRNRKHHYRQAIEAQVSGGVTVMDLAEALYVQRSTLLADTCIIVSTLAALRVEDTDGRKVYETAGALQHHFTSLTPANLEGLEKREGVVLYSLANVLRLHRPIVVMDEAHNARTPLSFETLARLQPSCIIEFTATPETGYDPEKELFASNVLHHVSAAELKEDDMVKLPIKLEAAADPKVAISHALQMQRTLEKVAVEEERESGEHLRPIVLLQAQPRSKEKQTFNVDAVRKCLIEDFRIPEAQIAVATGETREIDGVDLFKRDCQVRFIITVAALKEGWDCSFAYVLCSVADIRSARSVEQVLGRVLRLPNARRKRREELNCAYAFVASDHFMTAAQSLKDALVENGFERMEAEDLVTPSERQTDFLAGLPLFSKIVESVPEAPDLTQLDTDLRERVTYNEKARTITVNGGISVRDVERLGKCFSAPAAAEVAQRILARARGLSRPPAPSERGVRFDVPQLAIRVGKQLQIFEEEHFLEEQWDLSGADAGFPEEKFPTKVAVKDTAEFDVNQEGKIQVTFSDSLQRQLDVWANEPGWTVAGLVNWLDAQIRHPDLTLTQATLFIHRVVTGLIESRRFTLDQLAREKFRLRNAIGDRIEELRQEQRKEAFQRVLFSERAAEIEVSPEVCFSYPPEKYGPNFVYTSTFNLARHYYPQIGELRPDGEEFECASYLAGLDQVEYWVRNLERRVDTSFWLQTSSDRFYPDFVAKLKDGRILVVEYKGADRWSNDDSKEKRAIGDLWADRSKDRCIFVMPKGKDWAAIAGALQK